MVQWTVSFSSRINLFLLIFFHRAIVQPKLGGRPKKTRNKIRRQQKKPPGNKTHAVEYQQNKTRKKGRKNKERKKKKGKVFSVRLNRHTDRHRGRAKLLVPFQQPNKKHWPKKKKKEKGSVDASMLDSDCQSGISYCVGLRASLDVWKTAHVASSNLPEIVKHPIFVPNDHTRIHIGLVYFSSFSCFLFLFSSSGRSMVPLNYCPKRDSLSFFFFFFFCCASSSSVKEKNSGRSLTKRKEREPR